MVFVTPFYGTKVCPDVIAVSKTKLKDSITFPYKLPNYTFIQANSSTNAGGVGMFIKSKHSFNRVLLYDLKLILVRISGLKSC